MIFNIIGSIVCFSHIIGFLLLYVMHVLHVIQRAENEVFRFRYEFMLNSATAIQSCVSLHSYFNSVFLRWITLIVHFSLGLRSLDCNPLQKLPFFSRKHSIKKEVMFTSIFPFYRSVDFKFKQRKKKTFISKLIF